MTEADVVTLLRDAIWLTIKLSAPILIVGMVVGLIISIIQTTTSIQEQTLTFVPKVIATFITIVLLASWMIQSMLDYTRDILSLIAKY